MFYDVTTIIAFLALVAFGWWFYQRSVAVRRNREEEQREFGRHDHARAHEIAKLQSEESKLRGWF